MKTEYTLGCANARLTGTLKALLVIWVIFTCSTFYVCIIFSMDPLRSELKLYYYYNYYYYYYYSIKTFQQAGSQQTISTFSMLLSWSTHSLC